MGGNRPVTSVVPLAPGAAVILDRRNASASAANGGQARSLRRRTPPILADMVPRNDTEIPSRGWIQVGDLDARAERP